MSWYDRITDRILGKDSSSTTSNVEDENRQRSELDKKPPVSAGGLMKGSKEDEDEIIRIPGEELLKQYYEDALVHAGINFHTRHVTGEDFTVISNGNDNDMHRIREFIEDSDLRRKLGHVMRDLGIYGNSFFEIIWDKRGKKVVDLVPLDPKEIEFIKVKSGEENTAIATDDMGRPIGFIQKPQGFTVEKDTEHYKKIISQFKNDNINFNDLKIEEGIPFHRDKIVHFKLQKLSDTLMGIGLIEPVFDLVDMKMEIEDSLKEGVARASAPDLVGKVGTWDENMEVSAKDTKAMRRSLEKMRKKDYGVVSIPEYWNIEQLDTDVSGLDEHYQIFNDLISIGMGIPPGLLSRGEGVSSGIAEIHNAMTEKVMQTFQNSITHDCRKQIFTVILEKEVDEVPILEWKELNPLTKGKKARRIAELARSGLITRDRALEEHLRELEGLPPLPEEPEDKMKEREEEGEKMKERASKGQVSNKELSIEDEERIKAELKKDLDLE